MNKPATTIRYVTGDATHPQGAGPVVIAHVCNDAGRWGKGFVLAVSRRWSGPEGAYRAWARERADSFVLGEVQFVAVENDLWVANMLAQHGVGLRNGIPPIRYGALQSALRKLAVFSAANGASVHMPRIGCGLAGGDWEQVADIIQEELTGQGISVTVYDFAGSIP